VERQYDAKIRDASKTRKIVIKNIQLFKENKNSLSNLLSQIEDVLSVLEVKKVDQK